MKTAHFGSKAQIALPLRTARTISCAARAMPSRSRGILAVRAESGGMGNFFKKDDSKQDAARKALQEAFAGKNDPFQADEERAKKRGGGGGDGGSGGGGGGGGGGFNFGDFGDKFRKWLSGTFRAIAAALAFFTFISLFYLWKPLFELITKVVRIALRLDGNPRAQMAAGPSVAPDFNKKEGLGNVEESVISKYGAGDAEASEDDDDAYDDESEEE